MMKMIIRFEPRVVEYNLEDFFDESELEDLDEIRADLFDYFIHPAVQEAKYEVEYVR